MLQHTDFMKRRWPSARAFAISACMLGGLGSSPLLAQQPPSPVPLPENPLPTLQRLANIEAALNDDRRRWAETHNNALALSRDLEAARNRIAVLEGQLATLTTSYKRHGHEIFIWGDGCIALANVPQRGCVFIIGHDHPQRRSTTGPVELPPG